MALKSVAEVTAQIVPVKAEDTVQPLEFEVIRFDPRDIAYNASKWALTAHKIIQTTIPGSVRHKKAVHQLVILNSMQRTVPSNLYACMAFEKVDSDSDDEDDFDSIKKRAEKDSASRKPLALGYATVCNTQIVIKDFCKRPFESSAREIDGAAKALFLHLSTLASRKAKESVVVKHPHTLDIQLYKGCGFNRHGDLMKLASRQRVSKNIFALKPYQDALPVDAPFHVPLDQYAAVCSQIRATGFEKIAKKIEVLNTLPSPFRLIGIRDESNKYKFVVILDLGNPESIKLATVAPLIDLKVPKKDLQYYIKKIKPFMMNLQQFTNRQVVESRKRSNQTVSCKYSLPTVHSTRKKRRAKI